VAVGARAAAAGFGPDDVVLNAFGYHLSPAGAMFEEGARALGARVVPAGVGNLDLQARPARPRGDGLRRPAELPQGAARAARRQRTGTTVRVPAGLRHRRAAAAEPALGWTARVPVVRQGYGTAETGNLGYETDARDGLHVPDDALVQICDLTTGEARLRRRVGQVVVTLFDPDAHRSCGSGRATCRPGRPPCSCEHRTTPRIRGWAGRVGDAVKVRGMFLHPQQVDQAMTGLAGVAAYRVVVDRVEHRDELRCEVVVDGDADAVAARVAQRFREGLRFKAEVGVVEALPADAPRFVDERTWE
jgi:phenylacetate-CoA ligase